MNVFIEFIGLSLLITLCCLCAASDIKTGIVPNWMLAAFFAVAVIYDVACYGFFARDLARSFFLNVSLISLASLVLFYTHSFAGGDCKMAIVLSLLYPASCYMMVRDLDCTLVAALLFAFIFGHAYLLTHSIFLIAKKKAGNVTAAYIRDSVLTFVQSYLAAISYISMIVGLVSLFGGFGSIVKTWVTRIACIAVALCAGRYPTLRDWRYFLPAAVLALISSLLSGTIPLSLKPEYAALVFFLSICNATIKATVYEQVPIDELKKGMVLTLFSSTLMQTSKTKGLPGISTEDLRSRLNEDEVASVRAWAKATKTTSLTIVRKVPFAAMISAGYMLYAILGGVLRWS